VRKGVQNIRLDAWHIGESQHSVFPLFILHIYVRTVLADQSCSEENPILALGRLRQEDLNFKGSRDCLACLIKKTTLTQKRRGRERKEEKS
jgi:hypothetical protein